MAETLKILVASASALSDGRVAALAEFLGIPHAPLESASDAVATDTEPLEGCVIAHCDALGQLSDGELDRFLQSIDHLLVHGFTPGTGYSALLGHLTEGAVTAVDPVLPGKDFYSVSSSAKHFTRQFTGLSFGPANRDNDATFVGELGDDRIHNVIAIGERPFVVSTRRAGCEVFLVGSREIADLDETVPNGQSPLNWFSRLMPILMFLRHAFGAACWHNPSPGACFVIDDPVLWESYGFLNYRQLLEAMRPHPFAASLAFIPWNYRRTDAGVADLLKTSSGRLSLSIHGCDHTAGEFGAQDERQLAGKVETAARRMQAHRARFGLTFDKVMVFPQGIFSNAALKVLNEHNFLAAVNSTALPVNGAVMTLRDQLQPVAMRLHDFPLFTRRYPTDISQFACDLFLGRPVIAVEHHGYFRNGYEPLKAFVQRLNELEHLIWGTLGEVIRRTYLMREDPSGTVHVRFFANEVQLDNSTHASASYCLEGPDSLGMPLEGVFVNGRKTSYCVDSGKLTLSLSLEPGEHATIVVGRREPVAHALRQPSLDYRMRVFARRQLCELRDNHLAKSPMLLTILERARTIVAK